MNPNLDFSAFILSIALLLTNDEEEKEISAKCFCEILGHVISVTLNVKVFTMCLRTMKSVLPYLNGLDNKIFTPVTSGFLERCSQPPTIQEKTPEMMNNQQRSVSIYQLAISSLFGFVKEKEGDFYGKDDTVFVGTDFLIEEILSVIKNDMVNPDNI